MKHRKLISIMVSASMAFNVIGASARTLFADTEVPEEVQTEETELTTESSEADVTIEESVQTEEETSPAEPSEQIIDGDEETIESEESSETEGSEGEEPTGETDETTESSETSETDETTESSETSETSESTETSETEETEEEEEELVAFSAEAVIDGVLVSVTADEGVFPAGSYMEAYRVYDAGADALVDGSRGSDINVVRSLTFDITIYDEDGNEIEPDTEMGSVYVSFSDVLVADVNLDVEVYHITDNTAYEMSADVYDDTVVVETNSFSYYTVEFTYGNMEYVLPGDSVVALSDILTYVGLQGEVSAASVSNPSMFNAYQDNGVWYVSALNPFVSSEWMVVNISGVDYTIRVTDAIAQEGHNDYIGFRQGSGSPAGWSDRGYDIYGLDGTTVLRTTYNDAGYCSIMRVGSTTTIMADSSHNFTYGQVYTCEGVNAYITAAIQGERSVVVTYTMTNTTDNIITMDIGSWSDCKIGEEDRAPIEVNANGIRMYAGTNQFFLIPGSGDFDTCWYGDYSYSKNNVFSGTHTTGTLSGTDSGLAFSWNIIIPAGATVTRTAIFSVGANMTSYTLHFEKNSSEATGTMGDQLMIEGIAGSISGNRFTRPGYSFVGWAESPTGPVVYSDQQQITLSANKTLYAVWMLSSVILHDPTAIPGLVYNGSTQTLLTGGGAENGTIMFSLDRVNYSPIYPTGINATSYTIYYKAVGDPGYGDSEVRSITNSIARATATVTPPTAITGLVYNGSDQTLIARGSTDVGTLEYSLSETGGYSTTLPVGTNAGTYTVYYRVPGSSNYNAYGPFSLTVDIAKVDAVLDAAPEGVTVTYNATAQSLVTGGSATGGTIVYSLDGTNFSETITGTNAGNYTVYYKIQGDSNHNDIPGGQISSVINRAEAQISAVNMEKTYGESDPAAFEVTTTGVCGADTLVYRIWRVEGENAGVYGISLSCTDADNPNYTITRYDGGVFTIHPAPLTIAADNLGKIYGEADPALTATVTGVVGSDSINYTLSRSAGEDVGEYAITVSPGANPNYSVTIQKGVFTISAAQVVVTAQNAQKTYGDADPELTATVAGDVASGDTINYTLSRAEGENAGEYAITVTPGSNPNYDVQVVNATFTINRAPLTIAADDKTKTYGDADPEFTATITGTIIGDDTINYSFSRRIGENVDPNGYSIEIVLGENPNYSITTRRGTLTINPAEIWIIPQDVEKTYGESDPQLTAVIQGRVVEGDVINYTVSREQGENVGQYTISVNPRGDINYSIGFTSATFTINPAVATITADDQTKVYGEADPAFTVTIDGLVNGDTDLDYNIEYVHAEDVGDYEIIVTAGTNPNYSVSVDNGNFSITPADATITVVDNTKVYGSADPSFEVTYTGLVNGDTELEHTFERASGEDVGEYTVNAVNGNNPNYNVSVVSGTLAITPAAATITADNQTKVYGEADPEFTVTYTGLVNGDTALDYNIVCAHEENAGEYDIVVTAGTNPNYTVTVVNGLLTIKKADPVVTAPVGFSLIYSGDPQALFEEGSTTGGTMQYSLDGENYAAGMRSATDVGTYTIRYRVVGDNNYNDAEGGFVNTTITAPSGGNPTVPIYVDGQPVMVNPNEPIPHPTTPSRYGYDFDGWFADEACTIPIDFNSIVGNQGIRMYSKWTSIYYTLTEGADGTWFDGEGQLVFRAVRNRAEETTFSHYMNVYVDGNLLGANDFTAESGSVIIRLNPAYLATLAIGEHTLDIEFDDAEGVRTKFYILADASSTSISAPGAAGTTGSADAVGSTGEEFSIRSAMIITMLFAASGICALVSLKYRKETEE